MGVAPTQEDENRLGCVGCGTGKAGSALGELRPFLSLVWDARIEPMSVAPRFRWEAAAARDGA